MQFFYVLPWVLEEPSACKHFASWAVVMHELGRYWNRALTTGPRLPSTGNRWRGYQLGMAIYRCHIDISIFLNFECDTIFYFTYRYTFNISHQLSFITCYLFHLLLSHLMGLDQNLKNAHIFVFHNFLDVFR